MGDEVEAGEATSPLRDAIAVAEKRATRDGEPAEHCAGGACALAAPIARMGDEDLRVVETGTSVETYSRGVFGAPGQDGASRWG